MICLIALAKLVVRLPDLIFKVRLELCIKSFLHQKFQHLSHHQIELVTYRVSVHVTGIFRYLLFDHVLLEAGALHHNLDLTGALHQSEQISCFVYSTASSQKSMVLEHHDPTFISQSLGDTPALLSAQNHAAKGIIYGLGAPEVTCILVNDVEWPPERRPSLSGW